MSKPGASRAIIIRVAIGLILIGVAIGLLFMLPRKNNAIDQVKLSSLPMTSSAGFARVTGPMPFTFPADHGPHPAYQTEWWYYTGNLTDESGAHFGYQLTFFRRGLIAPGERAAGSSNWRTEQVYFAHFALTDVSGRKFSYNERFSRGSAGLAGTQGSPEFSVWLEDWTVWQTGKDTYRLQAKSDQGNLDLTLVDRKGPVLQGDRGFSPKGSESGNASAYISQTRLDTTGMISLRDHQFTVSGESWMDHEFSTSILSTGQVGWDWFSIQLDDGSELMLFNLRREDGTPDVYSAGTWIAPDGSTRALHREDFEITTLADWKSPHSGATYPARWQIRVPALELSLEVEPLLADQELNLSFTYWEGAVAVRNERDGKPVSGFGYVELTGYAKSMQGQF